ncbi:MAG TPA: hypothetical protein VGS19_38385 [Streptosporangiaceae bacterium]|nr:hypothetical protein [Streptosporangiaceae bacterium]
MTDDPAGATVLMNQLAAEFPGWRVWRTTDAGTWWASRRGPGWNTEPRTVAADTPDGLRGELLAAQGQL